MDGLLAAIAVGAIDPYRPVDHDVEPLTRITAAEELPVSWQRPDDGAAGDRFEHDDWSLEVAGLDRRRVARVRLRHHGPDDQGSRS